MNTVTPAAPSIFAAELVRRGLPIEYARSAAEEVADHHRDLVLELCGKGLAEAAADQEANRRLGDPRTLVKKTVREYQRRHWCGRWPFLTFLFGPIVLLVAYFVSIVLLAYCILLPLEKLGIRLDQTPPDGVITQSEYVLAMVGRMLTLFVGPAISLWVLARFAQTAAMRSTWLGLSTGVLTLVVSCIWCGFAGETSMSLPADQAITMLGLPFLRFTHDPMYVAQCLLPLGIGAGMFLSMRRQYRRAEQLILEDHRQGGAHDYAKCA